MMACCQPKFREMEILISMLVSCVCMSRCLFVCQCLYPTGHSSRAIYIFTHR